jgi:hypothetical protein
VWSRYSAKASGEASDNADTIAVMKYARVGICAGMHSIALPVVLAAPIVRLFGWVVRSATSQHATDGFFFRNKKTHTFMDEKILEK